MSHRKDKKRTDTVSKMPRLEPPRSGLPKRPRQMRKLCRGTQNWLLPATRCVSCGTNDHASWNRAYPTFLKKTEEFNSRNPENTLHFFPTTESWTWTPSNRNSTPAPTTHYKHNQDPDQEHPQQYKNKGKGKAPARNIDTSSQTTPWTLKS